MKKAARSLPGPRGGRPRPPVVNAAIRAVKKGGFVQGRAWRYIAVIVCNGSFLQPSTKVRKNDYVFWVNMDERAYTLTFTGGSPFDSQPVAITVPAKEPGFAGNWGISDRYRVRNDADLKDHPYNPTTPGWNGPPNPPDISVGG